VPDHRGSGIEESLEELAELATGAGAEVADVLTQARQAPDAATLIGRGKVEEIAAAVITGKVDVVIFDHDLTPPSSATSKRRSTPRSSIVRSLFWTFSRRAPGRAKGACRWSSRS
jgi:GTP-binding protein HflX